MTVSNTYNRPDQVSPPTRERVLEAARRLGYAGPDPAAASLRLRRSRTVGVVLTERLPYAFADPGLITILHGIATELSGAGNALLLVPAFGADGESLLRHAIVDALILCSLDGDARVAAAARERSLPVVTVGNPRLPKVPHIGPDNRRAAAEIAQYLLELGHRRFGLITTVTGQHRAPARPIFHERVTGFRDTVLGAGVQPGELAVAQAADNSR